MNVGQRRKIDEEASAKAGRCILQDTNNTTNDFRTGGSADPQRRLRRVRYPVGSRTDESGEPYIGYCFI